MIITVIFLALSFVLDMSGILGSGTASVVIFLIFGLFLIIKGGDLFVDSSAWIAEVSGIPKLIVGATVVSFATTLPELLVSSISAHKGEVDLSIGNAIGSVTANVGLIMAIGLIFMPCIIKRRDYAFKTVMMLTAGAALFLLTYDGVLSVAQSLVILVIFVLFMFDNVRNAVLKLRSDKKSGINAERHKPSGREIAVNAAKFIFGITAIVYGANLLSDNGQALAESLGVPARIIAVTIVAIGTSLPELVTTITAIVKKQSELSFGNIIGANIIDVTLILSVSAMVSKGGKLTVPASSVLVDVPIMLGFSAIALIPMLITKKFSRWQGVLLLGLYITYLVLTCFGVFDAIV